jgi:hypothetical protein
MNIDEAMDVITSREYDLHRSMLSPACAGEYRLNAWVTEKGRKTPLYAVSHSIGEAELWDSPLPLYDLREKLVIALAGYITTGEVPSPLASEE